jgi:hypothetical protein
MSVRLSLSILITADKKKRKRKRKKKKKKTGKIGTMSCKIPITAVEPTRIKSTELSK